MGFSYLTQNDAFNTSFFYNTTATGHRISAARAPENTLAALQEAINGDAKYIEIDVQETKDGELIIIHDSNFKRTTGVYKNTWEVNYDEVKTYDGSYFSSDFSGEKIPTLQEVIDSAKGKVELVIEIKLNGHEKSDVTKRVLDLIKANKIEHQSIIASMDKDVLKRVKELDSSIETCYLTEVAYGNLYNWDYVDSIITDNPYLVSDSIFWNKNGYINKVANALFNK